MEMTDSQDGAVIDLAGRDRAFLCEEYDNATVIDATTCLATRQS